MGGEGQGDTDLNKVGDSTDLNPPPPKKPKIDADPEAENADSESESDSDSGMARAPPGCFFAGDRLIRLGKLNDPEYVRQRKVFDDQFEDSEGFDVDWDSFDYKFFAMKLEWAADLDENLNNTELRTLLIETAIKDHNDEYDTKLELVEYVSANIMPCKGFMFYITIWAKDLSSPDPQPKLYQAKLRKFFEEILVRMVRLKPT